MGQGKIINFPNQRGDDIQVCRILPDRLKEARKARGYSQRELAEILGVSAQSVSQWELGTKSPSAPALFKLCDIVNIPVSYFTTDRPRGFGKSSHAFYRAFGPKTNKRNEQCDIWKEWLVQISSYFCTAVKLPDVVIPSTYTTGHSDGYSEEEIEEAANACRKAWGLGAGPIANVVSLMESKGIILTKVHFGAEEVNAFSYWNGDRPLVFLSTDSTSSVRARFDAAHELGHLILHRWNDSENLADPATLKRIEKEANRFASAFLLPESSYPNEVFTTRLDAFVELKRRWKVSIQAQVFRCLNLGIITDDQALNIRKSISRNRWIKTEPLDGDIPMESPSILNKCIDLILSSGAMSKGDILNALNLGPSIISDICGLSNGTFDEYHGHPTPVPR